MRIFARIFLGFWLATVVTIAVSTGSLLTLGSDHSSEFSSNVPLHRLTQCAEEALADHARGDPSAADRRKRDCEIRFLVNASGTDIYGQAIPGEVAASVRAVAASGDLNVDPLPQRTVVLLPVTDASNARYVAVFWRLDNRAKFIRNTLDRIAVFSLASGVICCLLTLYFLQPLARLGVIAQALGSGDLRVRVDPRMLGRRDEFGKLARIVNRMADRIELLVANEKRFLAHVSHELGSPLTRLNIALSLARRKAGAEMLPELDRIGHEAFELNGLVQQLLLLARLESGNELAREVGSYPIAELIDEVRENAAFEARQVDRSIVVGRAEGFTVKGHRDLLKSALDNVVRNALRFTKEGSAVQLDFFRRSDPNRGVIQVRDQGPGVDASKTETIFEPFVSAEVSGKHAGAGLGLAIARQAVLAHGGAISARNLAEGGLLIEIELPQTG